MGESGLYHYNDSGYKENLSKQQEQLAQEAVARSADKMNGMAEDAYMAELYPKDHEEYLVNGAILTCNKAIFDVKVLHGKVYNVKKPSKETVLEVTENP